MSVIDELVRNADSYGESFAGGELPLPPAKRVESIARIKASPFIPRKDHVRGFVYEVECGRLREIT